MLAVGFNLAQHRTQARVGIDTQHRGVGFAEQMAVGQLDEHGGRVVAPGQGMDAGQVPLLRSGYVCTLPKKQGAARISRAPWGNETCVVRDSPPFVSGGPGKKPLFLENFTFAS
ncbi:hypothetical protein D3C72_1957590 [compost metagenome]